MREESSFVPAEPTSVTPRVAIVQDQARRALRMAWVFSVAAAVMVVVPHRTGAWLPLHLFLVGALLLAVSGATRLFAVTWSAGDPAHPHLVVSQRWLLAIGAAGLAAGRELDAAPAVLAAGGLGVTLGLGLLGYLLIADVRSARVRRFRPALHYYLAAVAAGVGGTALGAAMVTGHAGLRDAHVIVNLLGLLGMVIAGTLPFFTATQARMKMSPRATPARLHRNLVVLATSVTVAALGAYLGHPLLESAGLAAYVAGLLQLVGVLPRPARKQFAWAGPRLAQLGLGMIWWAGTIAWAAVAALVGDPAFPERRVVALVIGGYAQILVASVAYLAPVLRGGGHQRLTAGFALTRSWTALATANAAAVAWIAGRTQLAGAAIIVLTVEVAVRGAGAGLISARHPMSEHAVTRRDAADV